MRSWMTGVVAATIAVSFLPALPSAWIISLLLGLAAVLWRVVPTLAQLCFGLFLGAAGGTLYGHSVLDHRVALGCEGQVVSLEGVIRTLPRLTPTRDGGHRQRFEFQPLWVEPARCAGPRRLLLSYYGEHPLSPGQHWRFSVKLKKPWGLANPGSFNMQSWYAQSGIDGTGNVRQNQAVLLSAARSHSFDYHSLRQRISQRIRQTELDEPVQAILQALTVADKSGIDSSLWTLLQCFGINHLLVISGLHVGIMAGAGYLFGSGLSRLLLPLGWVRCSAMMPAVTSFCFAFAYAALAGFALATVRALSMLACFVVALLFSRSSLSASNLLIAAVVVLSINPLAAVGSGFWLSFTAVACLLWLSAWRTEQRLPLRLLHTHGYMAIAMIPLGSWLFGGVSQVAMLANLALVPLVGLFVVPVALLGVASALLGMPGDLFLWELAGWPLQKLLPLALDVSQRYPDFLYLHLSPSLWEVGLALLAMALLIMPLPRGVKGVIPLLALPLFLPVQLYDEAVPDNTRITVLDVGQGSALVLQSGPHTLVYDTGGGDPQGSNMATWVILPFLRARGIKHIHTLIISHGDNDHSAGVDSLLQHMTVGQLIVGGRPTGIETAKRCRAGHAWRWPNGLRFQILSPAGAQELSSNDGSCVLQVHIGALRLLLPGDISAGREKELIRYWREGLHSELLQVAHHGSLSSSSLSWLKYVQPRFALFSSGYLNQFGHPHPLIRERYQHGGSRSYFTASDGALQLLIGPTGDIIATTYRGESHPYWM